ncbi:MAG: 50S ribosomal protein L9 [Gemmatimonadetes bacterium]|nr:50S ribosomal protein L9 [Gemmatimonadota bacterium]
MKVILTMEVADLGTRGDRVDVAAGYARNFLMPRRLAVLDTPGNARVMQEESRLGDVREKKARQEAQKVADWLNANEIFATLKIGREGKAFGAVTSRDLAVLLRQAGLDVDRRRIRLDAPIKRLGVFEVPLAIHTDVETNIKVYVDQDGGSKDGAAAQQAEWDAQAAARAEAERLEAEARAERAREAEEIARVAIEKAEARKAREAEEAKAREEAEAAKRAAGGGEGDDKTDEKAADDSEEPAGESA